MISSSNGFESIIIFLYEYKFIFVLALGFIIYKSGIMDSLKPTQEIHPKKIN